MKTLGIIGMGRIGRLVAARARAIDMHVIAFDPYVPEEVADSLRVELVELDTLESGPVSPSAYEDRMRANAAVLRKYLN